MNDVVDGHYKFPGIKKRHVKTWKMRQIKFEPREFQEPQLAPRKYSCLRLLVFEKSHAFECAVDRMVHFHPMRAGDIVLMHDDNNHTLQALHELLPGWEQQGWRGIALSGTRGE